MGFCFFFAKDLPEVTPYGRCHTCSGRQRSLADESRLPLHDAFTAFLLFRLAPSRLFQAPALFHLFAERINSSEACKRNDSGKGRSHFTKGLKLWQQMLVLYRWIGEPLRNPPRIPISKAHRSNFSQASSMHKSFELHRQVNIVKCVE